ncbi:hypothetical protein [Actinomadura monticuli]|uniref:Uncharacterized protein n=1 Tax=Actinomadura monticuli TaxID=3097367 RepID=A0ABV4Q2V2_9ACTN
MSHGSRRYRYVGPPEILAAVRPDAEGTPIGSPEDLASWLAPMDRAALRHPGGFTGPVVFRRCPRCHERNLVKDDDFTCAVCDAELPRTWNFDAAPSRGE